MKQRKTIAIIMTVILVLATVLAVFAAFRFEVQFPTNLNTFEFKDGSFTGSITEEIDLSIPGSVTEFQATVSGSSDTPIMYEYAIEAVSSTEPELLSSIFVYLNDQIIGTLDSLNQASQTFGENLFVLPGATETDTLRFELHIASNNELFQNATATVKVTCIATNHNAQLYSFVDSTQELIQVISEINRGATGKTVVLYGSFDTSKYTVSNSSNDTEVSVTPEQLTLTAPCSFDLQSNDITFGQPIIVSIDGTVTDDGIPTDIVTVYSSRSKFVHEGEVNEFAISKGAIDRKDTAKTVSIDWSEGTINEESVTYIITQKMHDLLEFGLYPTAEAPNFDLSNLGISCYINSVYWDTVSENATKAVAIPSLASTQIQTLTVSTGFNSTLTYDVKVFGISESVWNHILTHELAYLQALAQKESISHSIPLPTQISGEDTNLGKYHASIEWHTSDAKKMSVQGQCQANAIGHVTLTAVARINEHVVSQDFTFYLVTHSNLDKLLEMIRAIDPTLLVLADVWHGDTSTPEFDASSRDHVYLPVTTKNPDGTYTQTINKNVKDENGDYSVVTETLTNHDIIELHYELNTQNTHVTLFDTLNPNTVVLPEATFKTAANVQVYAKFANDPDTVVTSDIYISILMGSNADLGTQILNYVQTQMNSVDVLQNMLDTRTHTNGICSESGNFEMPVDYQGFEIKYTLNSASDTEIVTINSSDGMFVVHPEFFKSTVYDVSIKATVYPRAADGSTDSIGNIGSRDMSFSIPPAIHGPKKDAANNLVNGVLNDTNLFALVRMQVMQQTADTPLVLEAGKTYQLDTANYILLHDATQCTHLALVKSENSADFSSFSYTYEDTAEYTDDSTNYRYLPIPSNVSVDFINSLHYFGKLTEFTFKDFDMSDSATQTSLLRALAACDELTNLTLSNIGLIDFSSLMSLEHLQYLDVSYNNNLPSIACVADLNLNQLDYLNFAATAVEFDQALPLLTMAYNNYRRVNGQPPEYYYTHRFTPVADGALMLQPDAISVSSVTENGNVTTTVTISGSQLAISGLTYIDDSKYLAAGNTNVQIDLNKSVIIPTGATITVHKSDNEPQNSSAVVLENAIISFVIPNDTEDSVSSSVVSDMLFSHAIKITNVASISGNIITTTASSRLESADNDHAFAPLDALPQSVPILFGEIVNNIATDGSVTIYPLMPESGENSPAVACISLSGTVATIQHTSLTQMVVTGGDWDGNTVVIADAGGTVKVTFGGNPLEFAVKGGSILTVSDFARVQYDSANHIVTITQIPSNILAAGDTTTLNVSSSVSFSHAKIDKVTVNGAIVPTVTTTKTCTMTVTNGDASYKIILPAGISFPLPANAVGKTNAENTSVELTPLSNSAYSSGSYTNTSNALTVVNMVCLEDTNKNSFSDGWAYDNNLLTWDNATATVSPIAGTTAYLIIDNTWIPTGTISLAGKTQYIWDNPNTASWATFAPNDLNGYTITYGAKINSSSANINAAFSSTTSFTIAATALKSSDGTSILSNWVQPIYATVDSNAINPLYAGVRTVDNTQVADTIDKNGTAVYYSTELPVVHGGTLSETKVSFGDYKWIAIDVDGEYVTISNDPSSVTIAAVEGGGYVVTVTGGTSTIGKGALISKQDFNVSHDPSATDMGTFYIESVANGQKVPVTATFSQPDESDYTYAVVDGALFEPLPVNERERKGLDYLFMLSEVPNATHYTETIGGVQHGSYIHFAQRIYFNTSGDSAPITWHVVSNGTADQPHVKISERNGMFRLETIVGHTKGAFDVTVCAEVNVQGVVVSRYFTFTVIYN